MCPQLMISRPAQSLTPGLLLPSPLLLQPLSLLLLGLLLLLRVAFPQPAALPLWETPPALKLVSVNVSTMLAAGDNTCDHSR